MAPKMKSVNLVRNSVQLFLAYMYLIECLIISGMQSDSFHKLSLIEFGILIIVESNQTRKFSESFITKQIKFSQTILI